MQGKYDVEVLSSSPRLLLVKNFLSEEECQALIKVATREAKLQTCELCILLERSYRLKAGLYVHSRCFDFAVCPFVLALVLRM